MTRTQRMLVTSNWGDKKVTLIESPGIDFKVIFSFGNFDSAMFPKNVVFLGSGYERGVTRNLHKGHGNLRYPPLNYSVAPQK